MIVRVRCGACRHSMMAEAREAYQIGVRCENPSCREIIRTHQPPASAPPRRLGNPLVLGLLAVVLVAGGTFGIVQAFWLNQRGEKLGNTNTTQSSARDRERDATTRLWREVAAFESESPKSTDIRYAAFAASRYRSLSTIDADPMLADWVAEVAAIARGIIDTRAMHERDMQRIRARAETDQAEAVIVGGMKGVNRDDSFWENLYGVVVGAVGGAFSSQLKIDAELDRLSKTHAVDENFALDRLDGLRRRRRSEIEPILRRRFGAID